MSPHAVNNFVTDLVEMAKAMEELPKVRTDLAEAHAEVDTLRSTVQSCEERILNLKAEIESLNQRNHKLEAERDDAELRFLELEEKHGGLTKLIQAAASAVGMVDKPEPAPVNPTVQPEAQGSQEQSSGHTDDWYTRHEPMPSDGIVQPQGQSEADPSQSAASTEGQYHPVSSVEPMVSASQFGGDSPLPLSPASGTASPSPNAPSQPAEPTGFVSDRGGSVGKYAGKRWSEIDQKDFWDGYNSSPLRGTKEYWLANGGTLDNFYA